MCFYESGGEMFKLKRIFDHGRMEAIKADELLLIIRGGKRCERGGEGERERERELGLWRQGQWLLP